jgi:hypothetical protein
VKTRVSLPLKAAGGTGSLSWSASGLPAGLSIDAATGLISGVATAEGPQTGVPVTVTVTDRRGATGSTTFIWDVLGVRTNNVGDTVNLQFTLPTGNPVKSVAADLPPGLSISATGLVSGTTTGGTRHQPVLTLTDVNGRVWLWTFIWQVDDPSRVQIITIPDRASDPVGKPVSFTAQAAGGSGTGYRWTTTGTGLPPGVTINGTTGLISGTPTTVGTYTVKLTVRDSNNNTAVYMFNWGIQ